MSSNHPNLTALAGAVRFPLSSSPPIPFDPFSGPPLHPDLTQAALSAKEMAFITPSFTSTQPISTQNTSLSVSRPVRLTHFVQSSKSLCVSPLWRDALRKSESSPLVITAPVLATIGTDNPQLQILITGPPASGKGTQCEYIAEKYGVVHISTGDMLRAAVKAETPLGVEAKSYMDDGRLVPDQLVISMLKDRISQEDCVRKGWLLDGFPRTQVQAQALTDANIMPSAVIVLDVEDEELITRVTGRRSDPVTGKIYHLKFNPPSDPEVAERLTQRSDDTEEKARVRLKNYYKNAQSIQDHYSSMLKKVDGNRSKSEVFNDVSAIIDAAAAEIENDDHGSLSQSGTATAAPTKLNPTESTKGMPVAEFVRRAEEAYETSLLNNEDVSWSGQAAADSVNSAGTSTYNDLLTRLDLVFGDTVALLAFAYIGRARHGSGAVDFGVLKTAAPFIVAWLGVTPLLGAYTRNATANVSAAIKTFVRSWVIAIPMGIALRGKFANSFNSISTCMYS